MHPIAKSRFASGSICLIRNCATNATAFRLPADARAGALRSAARARRLRRRLRRPHQGSEDPQHRQPGAAAARQPAPPGRVRMRGEHRRRRRHSDADARPVPAEGSGPHRNHPAARARLWRRPGVPAARSGRARAGRDAFRRNRDRGRPARARLARRSDRRPQARPERGGGRARLQADFHRPRPRGAGPWRLNRERRPVRAQAVRDPEADRARDRRGRPAGRGEALLLRRQPVVEHVDLQGDADGRSDRGDVPGPDRPDDGVGARAGAPAIQHQYISVVAARPPLPFCRSQRRDQHPAREYQLDEGARGAAAVRRARP